MQAVTNFVAVQTKVRREQPDQSVAELQQRTYDELAKLLGIDPQVLREKLPQFAEEVKRAPNATVLERAAAAVVTEDYVEAERLALVAADQAQKATPPKVTDAIQALQIAGLAALLQIEYADALRHLRAAEKLTDPARDRLEWADVQWGIAYVLGEQGHYRATLGADGEPLVDGQPWRELDVRDAAGPDARLVRDDGVERFDVLPLLVATDGAIAAFGHDGRRLRPNIVISGVNGLEERQWEGKTLRTGEAVIGIQDLRERCIMTTFDPDTLVQDADVLRKIRREFGGLLALNCYVVKGGTLRAGDEIEMS